MAVEGRDTAYHDDKNTMMGPRAIHSRSIVICLIIDRAPLWSYKSVTCRPLVELCRDCRRCWLHKRLVLCFDRLSQTLRINNSTHCVHFTILEHEPCQKYSTPPLKVRGGVRRQNQTAPKNSLSELRSFELHSPQSIRAQCHLSYQPQYPFNSFNLTLDTLNEPFTSMVPVRRPPFRLSPYKSTSILSCCLPRLLLPDLLLLPFRLTAPQHIQRRNGTSRNAQAVRKTSNVIYAGEDADWRGKTWAMANGRDQAAEESVTGDEEAQNEVDSLRLEEARRFLHKIEQGQFEIPRAEVETSTSRSSGPGGQNVNK